MVPSVILKMALGVSTRSWRGVFQAVRLCSGQSSVVGADHPQIQSLLKSLCGLQLSKVMARRKEPLVVPRYQLMTFEQLQQVRNKRHRARGRGRKVVWLLA